jgi:hypothetical protein
MNLNPKEFENALEVPLDKTFEEINNGKKKCLAPCTDHGILSMWYCLHLRNLPSK